MWFLMLPLQHDVDENVACEYVPALHDTPDVHCAHVARIIQAMTVSVVQIDEQGSSVGVDEVVGAAQARNEAVMA